MKPLVLIILLGVIVLFLCSKLPGTITIRGNNCTLYIPIIWMLVVSIILSFIFSAFHH